MKNRSPVPRIRAVIALVALVTAMAAPTKLHAEVVLHHTGYCAPPVLEKSTYFMHARYYSPNLGRFLSVDPMGGSVGSSQSWNRYSYVLNNPIGFVDPDGEAVFTLLALGAGGTALLKAAGVTVFVGSAVGTGILLDHLIHSNDVPAPPIKVAPVDGSLVPTLDGVDNPGYVDGSLAPPPPIPGTSAEPSPVDGTIATPITEPAVDNNTMSKNKGRGRDSGYEGKSTAALEQMYNNATGKEKLRLQRELKNRPDSKKGKFKARGGQRERKKPKSQ